MRLGFPFAGGGGGKGSGGAGGGAGGLCGLGKLGKLGKLGGTGCGLGSDGKGGGCGAGGKGEGGRRADVAGEQEHCAAARARPEAANSVASAERAIMTKGSREKIKYI
jgi:hypothetical protein